MFSSLESILQKVEGADLLVLWAKYYTEASSMPKEFYSVFPQLQNMSDFFGNFKEIESKSIKKIISNITDKHQLYDLLANKFQLGNPINNNALKVFVLINNLPNSKSAKKSVAYLFENCIRIFIQISYQIYLVLGHILEEGSPVPEFMHELHRIVFFFSFFEDEQFMEFYLILKSLLSHISFRFDQILVSGSTSSLQEDIFAVLNSLVGVSRSYLAYNPGTESMCIKFITEQLDKIFVIMTAGQLSKQMLVAIRSILSSVVPDVGNIIPSQCKQLGEIAVSLIAAIVKASKIDNTEIYQSVLICLKLFNETCKYDENSLPKYLFSSLTDFIHWLILTSTYKLLEDVVDVPEPLPVFENLGPLSREDYFANHNLVVESKALNLSERLQSVAEIILQIISHYKDPSPFVANLIESIIEQEVKIEPEPYKAYLAFVLYLVSRIPENIVNAAVNNNWDFLISEKAFPLDTTQKCDVHIQRTITSITCRAFINSPESRQTILSTLNSYFEKNSQSGIIYFYNLLNSLLVVADSTDFIPILTSSKLIHKIVLIAQVNLTIFDFLRTCIFLKPSTLLVRQDILDFLNENCERDKYSDSIVSLFGIGFSLLDDNANNWTVLSSLLKSTSKILNTVNPVIALSIINFAYGKVNTWPSKLIDSLACKKFVEATAMIPLNIYSIETFAEVVRHLTDISRMNPQVFFMLTQPDITIYDSLKQAAIHKDEGDIEPIIKVLFEFSFSSRTSKGNGYYIRNSKVLEVILEWIKNTKHELTIIQQFNKLAMKSMGNIFQMNKAKIPEYILTRIEECGDNVSVISEFLTLFSQLCMYVFNTSILYAGIELMKSVNFKYPNLILSTFFRLITDEQLTGPNSFFHFDGTATGIFAAETIFNENDCMFLSARIDQNLDLTIQPLVYITNDNSEQMIINLNGNKLNVNYMAQKVIQKADGVLNIETNSWFSLAIVLSQKGVQIYANGNPDIQLPPLTLGKRAKIYIGNLTDSMNSNGLIGDIGPVVIVKNGDPHKLSIKMSTNDIIEKYGNDVIFRISSRTTFQNTVLNVSEQSQAVQFRGQPIFNVSTILDTLKSVGAIPNLMPLITRLSIGESTTSGDNGSEMLIALIQIFVRLMQKHHGLVSAFMGIKGAKLLCGFLAKVDPLYFDERTLSTIMDLYHVTKENDYLVSLVQDLYLSVDFVKALKPELQQIYFSSFIPTLYNSNKIPFTSFQTLDFIVCRALQMTTLGIPVASAYWNFILKMVTPTTLPVLMTILISIIAKSTDHRITVHVLDLYAAILDDENSKLSNVVTIYDYYLPFVYSLINPIEHIQRRLITLIDKIIAPPEKLEQYAILASLNHIKCSNPYAFSSYLWKAMSNNHPQLFPLLVKSIYELPEANRQVFYSDVMTMIFTRCEKSIIDLKNWYFWVISFSMIYHNPKTQLDKIIEPLIPLLDDTLLRKRADDLAEIISMIGIIQFNYGVSTRELKKNILIHILNEGSGLFSEVFKDIYPTVLAETFKFIFFHMKIDSRSEYSSYIPSYLSAMVPELKYMPTEMKFGINQDENGFWIDLDIAKVLLDNIQYSVDCKIKIFNTLEIDSTVASAYIATLVARFNEQIFKKSINGFLSVFKDTNYDDAYTAACFIYLISKKLGIPLGDNLEKLKRFVYYYTDDDDSPELRYYIFEESLEKLAENAVLFLYAKEKSDLINTMLSRYSAILHVPDLMKLKDTPESPIFIQIIKTASPQVLNLIQGSFDRIMTKTKSLEQQSYMSLSKLISSFMRELSTSGGPWTEKDVVYHYKMSPYVSSRGQRVILSINHHFDDHKKASELRDSGISTAEATQNLPRFKVFQGSTPVAIKTEGFHAQVELITEKTAISGIIQHTKRFVYFTSKHGDKQKYLELQLDDIEFIFIRKQVHQETACEIFMNTNRSFYFIFSCVEDRATFFRSVNAEFMPKKEVEDPHKFFFFSELRKANESIVQTLPAVDIVKALKLPEKWAKYKITTFEYLHYLNILAGRSFNDLSQYPVYPWVLKDYDVDRLILGPSTTQCFRDLTKPIGTLNKQRISDLMDLYRDFPMPEEKCLYRSHFSTMASVSSFLIRQEPYTSLHIALQEGRFDVPGRLFHSIPLEWKAVTSEENDFRELIPEFYCFPDFLVNSNGFDLGARMKSDGTTEKLGDVVLPKWCKSARAFVVIHREALESEYVSKFLPAWIDLIFGVNRCSEKERNVFHPLSYPEKPRPDDFPIDRVRNHCLNFGVCPDQIFNEPHIQREVIQFSPNLFSTMIEVPIISMMKGYLFLSGSSYIDARYFCSGNSQSLPGTKRLPGQYGEVICVSKSFGIVIFKKPFDDFVTAVELEREHVRRISHEGNGVACVAICGGRVMITGGNDCSLRLWNLPSFTLIRSSTLHGSPVVAVGANADLGIVASIDKQGVFIIETLMRGHFLCNTEIKVENSKPTILVFKSGLILLALTNEKSTTLSIYDTKLAKVSTLELTGSASDITKITDERGAEFVTMVISGAIIILEAFSLNLLATIPAQSRTPHVCSVRKQRLLMVGDGKEFKTYPF